MLCEWLSRRPLFPADQISTKNKRTDMYHCALRTRQRLMHFHHPIHVIYPHRHSSSGSKRFLMSLTFL